MVLTPGAVLNGEQILHELEAGRIFRDGTWDTSCIRASGYDLRMANDLILVPDPPNSRGRYYPRGRHRHSEVILEPGDVAFVSSLERVCIPWDRCGILGPKFGLVAKGILTLTGQLVDPGYGLKEEEGEWIANSDQRLHFLLANVGPAPIVLVPGQEKIATLQLSAIKPPEEKREVVSVGYERIEDAYLSPDKTVQAGLVFFRKMSDLAQQMSINDVRMEEYNRRLSGVEAGSNQIVMFGVYLLCVTFLGVCFTILLSVVETTGLPQKITDLSNAIIYSWPGALVLILILIGIASILWMFLGLLTRTIHYLVGKRGALRIHGTDIDSNRGKS